MVEILSTRDTNSPWKYLRCHFLELFWCLCLKLKVDFTCYSYEEMLWCFSCFSKMFSRSIFIFMNPKQRLPTFSSFVKWFILSLCSDRLEVCFEACSTELVHHRKLFESMWRETAGRVSFHPQREEELLALLASSAVYLARRLQVFNKLIC